MAEYYPLISRAVAGLRGGAPEARQAIYSRAKQALVAQLRGMQPPVPDEAIGKEVATLDEAVARIEAELTAAAHQGTPASDEGRASPTDASALQPSVAAASGPLAPIAPSAPGSIAAPSLATKSNAIRPPAPVVSGSAGGAPARAERAVFERRSALPPARPLAPRSVRPTALGRPPAEAKDTPLQAADPLPSEPATGGDAPVANGATATPPEPQPVEPAPAESSAMAAEPKVAAMPVAPTLAAAADAGSGPDVAPSVAPLLRIGRDEPEDTQAAPPVPDILAADIRGREEGVRPAMPRQTVRKPRDLRVWIVAIVALAAVVAIALTAWKLKDNPQELARVPAPQKAEPATGKIAERADAGADDADSDAAGSPAAATPPASAPQQTASPPATPVQQPAGDQGIAVSYKAAVLVAAPDTPEKVKAYVGTVVWRTESVAQGQDQSLATAVRADIDVPEAKMQAVMELRKNTEAQFPASHTIDLKFTIGAGSPVGDIKQIDVPRMRNEDANPTGDPLIGVPVTITSNYFLVGLTRGAAEQRNVDALRNRGWFDIPMVLSNGTPAKITFEKGASGNHIIEDALAAWSRS